MSASTNAPVFDTVALIGIGLIGSSLARVIRSRDLARRIHIHSRREATRRMADDLKLGDLVADQMADAVRDADLVVLCTPVGSFDGVLKELAPHLKSGAIVSDVGSVKQSMIDAARRHVPEGCPIVPAHPIAGTEHSGPASGFAELFDGRWCVLTPEADTDPAAVDKVVQLWRRAGSTVEQMEAAHHDVVLAITSHIPHLIAFNIVGTVADLEDETKREAIKYAAGGFRDFTRIAASDPVMWRDIFLNNREAVLEMLARFNEDLSQLQRAIRKRDGAALEDMFTRTRAIRRGVIEADQA